MPYGGKRTKGKGYEIRKNEELNELYHDRGLSKFIKIKKERWNTRKNVGRKCDGQKRKKNMLKCID